MKSLGYGRLISLDNFRHCNFELVADILYFLCHRLQSSIDLSDDISTKSKRVEFIKQCANMIAANTQIKLKLKSLYKADGYAVKELLKVALFLNDANNAYQNHQSSENSHPFASSSNSATAMNNITKLREYTNLSSQIIENGVKLHNLLSSNNNQKKHSKQNKIVDEEVILFLDEMSHNIENYDKVIRRTLERKLNECINDLDDHINDLQHNKLIEAKQNEQSLEEKAREKENEWHRLNKRVLSLKHMKPPFIEEYELLESKNTEIYQAYCEKFRNLSYLQSMLNQYRAMEEEKERKSKQRLKAVQQKLRNDQQMKLLTTEFNGDEPDEDGVDDLDVIEVNQRRGNSNRSQRQQGNSRTHTNSNMSSGRSSSVGSSSATSPSRSQSMTSGTQSRSQQNDDEEEDASSMGSISDIGDEHLQF